MTLFPYLVSSGYDRVILSMLTDFLSILKGYFKKLQCISCIHI